MKNSLVKLFFSMSLGLLLISCANQNGVETLNPTLPKRIMSSDIEWDIDNFEFRTLGEYHNSGVEYILQTMHADNFVLGNLSEEDLQIYVKRLTSEYIENTFDFVDFDLDHISEYVIDESEFSSDLVYILDKLDYYIEHTCISDEQLGDSLIELYDLSNILGIEEYIIARSVLSVAQSSHAYWYSGTHTLIEFAGEEGDGGDDNNNDDENNDGQGEGENGDNNGQGGEGENNNKRIFNEIIQADKDGAIRGSFDATMNAGISGNADMRIYAATVVLSAVLESTLAYFNASENVINTGENGENNN